MGLKTKRSQLQNLRVGLVFQARTGFEVRAMPDRVIVVDWDDHRKVDELSQGLSADPAADVIVFGTALDSAALGLIEQAIAEQPAVDVIVACDPHDLPRRMALDDELPAWLSLLAASPAFDPAVAVRTKAWSNLTGLHGKHASAEELVVRTALNGKVQAVEVAAPADRSRRCLPSLTIPASNAEKAWLQSLLTGEPLPVANPHSPETTALRAGLLLMNDFFDASHSCSQSMEGHPHADYWHAILHRREPDYGNAKYWFRHVGRHAIFEELARCVSTLFDSAAGSLTGKLERWRPRLITAGGWEPFVFVDLCQTAASDAELRSWCEQVQFTEMLLLLAVTADFV